MANSKEATAAPTKKDLAELARVRAKRKELQRQADALEKQEKLLSFKVVAWAAEQNQASAPQAIFRRLGFLIELGYRPGTVKWKDAFIEQAGPEAAAKLQQQAAAELKPFVEVKAAA